MKAENTGYLFWGAVGTGKSFLAGCIANALLRTGDRSTYEQFCGSAE